MKSEYGSTEQAVPTTLGNKWQAASPTMDQLALHWGKCTASSVIGLTKGITGRGYFYGAEYIQAYNNRTLLPLLLLFRYSSSLLSHTEEYNSQLETSNVTRRFCSCSWAYNRVRTNSTVIPILFQHAADHNGDTTPASNVQITAQITRKVAGYYHQYGHTE